MQRENVCAVVVTYNRKEMLAGCLDALLAQSYPVERVLVVDNASTDGTADFLAQRGYCDNPRITYVGLTQNGGGAGGFHEGFKRALESQPDWIWAMDDDGLAHRETLEQLVNAPSSAGQFRGPLVLAREQITSADNNQLAFPGGVDTHAGVEALRTRADIESRAHDGVLQGYACIFNGVLIHRELVERMGLPDWRFFVWGDEWDYFFRARRVGVQPTTVTRALYWHPLDRAKRAQVRFCGKEYIVPHADGELRNYLIIRNHGYLAHRYRGWVAWLRHTLKYVLYHRTAEGCFTSWQVLRYSVEGLRGRFAGRGRFGE